MSGGMAQPYPQTPVLDMGIAAVCLVVNIIIPGIGTIIAGIVGAERTIGRGIAQLLLSIIIVGWIWGLVTGIQLMINASWKAQQ